jgi:hypothetical protein
MNLTIFCLKAVGITKIATFLLSFVTLTLGSNSKAVIMPKVAKGKIAKGKPEAETKKANYTRL